MHIETSVSRGSQTHAYQPILDPILNQAHVLRNPVRVSGKRPAIVLTSNEEIPVKEG
jgi:hypothetical protein